MSTLRAHFRSVLRVHTGEGGFSIIEGVMAGMILALGAFAVGSSLSTALQVTGYARQKQGAEALANQAIEQARALAYDNLGLLDAGPLAHSADPTNPDYWIDQTNQTFDPDGSGLAQQPESLVLGVAGSSVSHGPALLTRSNTQYSIYDYVTWVDSPAVSGVQDAKRVTAVVAWKTLTGVPKQIKVSSLFANLVPSPVASTPPANRPPQVSCPTSSSSGLTANFTAVASDPDGSITRVDWDFGDGTILTNGGTLAGHTYASAGTYHVANAVFDNAGAAASNDGLNCEVTVLPPDPGADVIPPSGTVSIANGSTYTKTTQLTLYLSATDNVGVTAMAFSSDGLNFGSSVPYSTTVLFTLPSGDGTRTVYAVFSDAAGNRSVPASDTIILDTVAPSPPTGLTVDRTNLGKTFAILQWTASSSGDVAGYQVFRRPTTSSTFSPIACNYIYGSPTKCKDPSEAKGTTYVFYVVAVDQAGNLSGPSNQVSA
jgi:type II secretory pathway pseudopilin PulG